MPPPLSDKERRREYQKTRDPSRQEFYRSTLWRDFRAAILAERPLCVVCEKAGRVTAATVLDHIQEVADRPDLALDPANVQPMCLHHHQSKSAIRSNKLRAKK